MNAIKLINAFWEKAQDDKQMKPSAIAVFFALFYFDNKCGWKEWFDVEYGEVRSLTGISKNTYYDGIAILVAGNYVAYQAGPNQYRAAKFKMHVLYQNLGQHEVEQADSTRLSKQTARGRASRQHEVEQADSSETIHKLSKVIKPINLETSKTEVVEVSAERAAEFDQAVKDFCEDPYPWEKEEKKVAPKKEEKPLPSVADAQAMVGETAHWRNTLKHYAITEANREKLFSRFYEQKEDLYRIRYPSREDMAQNFYFWIESLRKLDKLNDILREPSNDIITNPPKKPYNRTSTSDKHAELRLLAEQSTEFARRSVG